MSWQIFIHGMKLLLLQLQAALLLLCPLRHPTLPLNKIPSSLSNTNQTSTEVKSQPKVLLDYEEKDFNEQAIYLTKC